MSIAAALDREARGDLANRWRRFRTENPKTRIRDAARTLGVSEADLVATGLGDTAVQLRPDWSGILNALPAVGRVMALTRNDSCVHERHGRYEDVQVSDAVGLVLGPDIDLRLFLSRWTFAFAVTEGDADHKRRSIQIFDDCGSAVHKVYATADTDQDAFTALINRFAVAAPTPIHVAAPKPPATPRPDAEIDAKGLIEAWRGLQDTHDFFPMLRKYKAARLQAFRLAGPELAQQLPSTAGRLVLERAAAAEMEIMIFVGNPNAIQIHTGPVKKLVTAGPWFNVLDPTFNLHLREDHIASAWCVRKPSVDGDVTSVELFDAAGDNIAMIFGKRKPGVPENPAWRALANDLPRAV